MGIRNLKMGSYLEKGGKSELDYPCKDIDFYRNFAYALCALYG